MALELDEEFKQLIVRASVADLRSQAEFWLLSLSRCVPCERPDDEIERQRQISDLAAEVREYDEMLGNG